MISYAKRNLNSSPTPCNLLVICDKCKTGDWTIDSDLLSYCHCGARKRKATSKEYTEAINQ